MTKDELLERLKGYEWTDVEFKAAQKQVSDSAYETVSAFSNTSGGWLVFGIKEASGTYDIVGVIEVDKVQNDFLSCLRAGDKLGLVVNPDEQMLSHESKTLLVFRIPEARRQDKPVCLNGDIKRSYVRRGACDEKCTMDEIHRFLRDAAGDEYDGETLDFDPEHCFDSDSVQWYRNLHPGNDDTLTDLEYLHHWGLVKELPEKLLPTRAGILVFGAEQVVRQVLPRPVLDCQWVNISRFDELPSKRWDDRLVVEANIIQAWRGFVQRYGKNSENPFSVDSKTLQRDDTPPDYIAMREAVINLLIHQDYGDHKRIPVVQFYRDCTVLWNPGDSSTEELLEPGQKPVRNPRIVNAFRRIGFSEQAGTGVRAIFKSWRELGRIPPEIRNDKAGGSFEIVLPKQELLTEEQVLLQAGIGVRLSKAEAAVFALACRQDLVGLVDVKAVTGLSSPDAQELLDRLVVQSLIDRVDGSHQAHYIVKEHFKGRFAPRTVKSDQPETPEANLVTDQVPRNREELVTDQGVVLKELSETQWRILMLCDVPQSLDSIMEHLKLTHRSFFVRKHLKPMLLGNILRLKYPEQPNHPGQAYVLTEAGVELKARRLSTNAKTGNGDEK